MNNIAVDVLDNLRHHGWLEEVGKDNQIVLIDTNDVRKSRTKYNNEPTLDLILRNVIH